MFNHYHTHHHYYDDAGKEVIAGIVALRKSIDLANERLNHMATQAQLDKLKADIAALIQAGVEEINAAVAAAQNVPPEKADAAIDDLDTQVTAATQALTDAAAKLRLPPAS